MEKVQITLHISDDVVNQAQAAGILNDETMERLIRAELERRETQHQFIQSIKKIASVEPPLTLDEIQAELDAYYAELESDET